MTDVLQELRDNVAAEIAGLRPDCDQVHHGGPVARLSRTPRVDLANQRLPRNQR